MAKGNIAKQEVINKIIAAFGDDYVTTIDGKVYVWAKENGEKLQIALSLTCPKNLVGETKPTKVSMAAMDFGGSGGWDFEAMDNTTTVPQKSTEISQQEIDNLEVLMARLGLT